VTGFSFEQLRRFPDLEADNLYAVDATDRLLLDEADLELARSAPGDVVIIGDHFGALTVAAAGRHHLTGIRVFQDPVTGERALAANAERAGTASNYRSHSLDRSLLDNAKLVLVQLPKSLAELRELADLIARYADPAVTVFLGGRVKHMTVGMNDVLGEYFGSVRASLARQKSRLLVATEPQRPTGKPPFPVERRDEGLGLTVCAYGGAFGGTALDAGTARLLSHLDRMRPGAGLAIDLGCGTGILASALAKTRPGVAVIATDRSAAAVASAQATVTANGQADRIVVQRDDAMSQLADASADLILCNPPFHLDTSVHAGAALKLFEAAGRVLRPAGELWTVFNSHLGYRANLQRLVGETRLVERGSRFSVAVSTRS
jgi:16S rRNA (guanine1207-N2)-methyltransferase